MTLVNVYQTLVQARIDILHDATDSAEDTRLEQIITEASRWIDGECQRRFYPVTETRVYTPGDASFLDVDDLLSITTLKTDQDGDRSFETTWAAATDYYLWPDNAAAENKPYTRIVVDTVSGINRFPVRRQSVQIVGSFGYCALLSTSTATLGEDLDLTETGVDVTSGPAFAVGQTILIGSEQMAVLSIASNTLTVTRGLNGTTAATHSSGAAIQVSGPIMDIQQATRRRTVRQYKLPDAPLGMITPDQGPATTVKLDAEIERLIRRYRKDWLFA